MVLGITAEPMQDAEARKRALNSELANGRLAMMAILGLWVQDGLFGTPYGLYTGSSAFETWRGEDTWCVIDANVMMMMTMKL